MKNDNIIQSADFIRQVFIITLPNFQKWESYSRLQILQKQYFFL